MKCLWHEVFKEEKINGSILGLNVTQISVSHGQVPVYCAKNSTAFLEAANRALQFAVLDANNESGKQMRLLAQRKKDTLEKTDFAIPHNVALHSPFFLGKAERGLSFISCFFFSRGIHRSMTFRLTSRVRGWLWVIGKSTHGFTSNDIWKARGQISSQNDVLVNTGNELTLFSFGD